MEKFALLFSYTRQSSDLFQTDIKYLEKSDIELKKYRINFGNIEIVARRIYKNIDLNKSRFISESDNKKITIKAPS